MDFVKDRSLDAQTHAESIRIEKAAFELGTLPKICATALKLERQHVGIARGEFGRLRIAVSQRHGEAPSPRSSVAGSNVPALHLMQALCLEQDWMWNQEIPVPTIFLWGPAARRAIRRQLCTT
jgi:hypothetical protein